MKRRWHACFEMFSELAGVKAKLERFIHTDDAIEEPNGNLFEEERAESPGFMDVSSPSIVIYLPGRWLAVCFVNTFQTKF